MVIKNIIPLYDKVVVEAIKQNDKSAGGLYIPETAKDKPTFGTVKWVGSGNMQKDGSVTPLSVKSGDTVMYSKWSGNEIEIDNKKYLIMSETDILAKVE